MRVRIYVRVSTDEQAAHGFSLAAQEDACRAFCCSQGWTVAAVYIDDGYPAKDTARPALQRMLTEVQSGDVVVVWRLDRLTRRVIDLFTMLESWDKRDVRFRSVTEVFDTTTAIGRLFITLVAALAQWERENIGERVQLGMKRAAAEGRRSVGTQPKFGYRFDEGHAAVNDEHATVIRLIDEWYLSGIGLLQIVTRLNSGGYPRPGTGQWALYTVRRILGDEQYTGVMVYNKTQRQGTRSVRRPPAEWVRAEGALPAIRTPETQQQLNALLTAKGAFAKRGVAGRAAAGYLLTGLLRCGCGARMVHHTMRKRNTSHKPIRAYCCTARQQHGTCSAPWVNAERLEATVLERLRERAVLDSIARRRLTVDTADANQQARALDQQYERLLSAYKAGVLPLERFAAETRSIDTARSRLQATADRAAVDESTVAAESERLLSSVTALQDADRQAQKAFLLAALERITVSGADVQLILRS